MDSYPMTIQCLKKLEAELKRLKEVDRPANVKAIETAREHGDLSENAEYKAAKEQQSLIAGRMDYLSDRISRANVIDISKLSGERVVFGAVVTIEDLDSNEEKKYQILGDDEADIDNNIISVSSPIARGLIGKEAGDEVTIATPSGKRSFEIVDVAFSF